MLLRYLVFCMGCGMLQTAYQKIPLPNQFTAALDVPIIFMQSWMRLLGMVLALSTVLAELLLGFHFFRWWGLIVWLPCLWATTLVFRGRNPAPAWFIGILVSFVGAIGSG